MDEGDKRHGIDMDERRHVMDEVEKSYTEDR